MKCCRFYYAAVLASDDIQLWWLGEWSEKAILCGHCCIELTIGEYMAGNYSRPAAERQ